jgi:predicted KAP-like P-loop ATPase
VSADDTRDRVIALEVQVRNLEGDIQSMARKVDVMHEILLQAKGARWVIIGTAAIAGGIASFLLKLIPWSATLPK